ncbi:MAG: hypothetical protein K5798_10160 [Nitrosopumilus sp.]|nr:MULTISPECIES: hypothetical protein [Nitrosopumilus]MCV0367608.1 hypothetical protein [Nitrosopumilus sp.]BDQ30545.1 hypothetical protein NZOSNM25_000650 [Nitrosopumilus zosterae]
MRYIEPTRVKVLMMMFYATGIVGIVVGLAVAPPSMTVMITFMALINVGLGAFFTFIFLTQVQKAPDKRKKKRKSD